MWVRKFLSIRGKEISSYVLSTIPERLGKNLTVNRDWKKISNASRNGINFLTDQINEYEVNLIIVNNFK